MSYGFFHSDNPHLYPRLPKHPKEQYDFGYKEGETIWNRMTTRATLGDEVIKQGIPPIVSRSEPRGTPISNTLQHLTFCDFWDDYRSHEYIKGICDYLEKKIREEIQKENSAKS
jgi:hypothetical protein